MTRVVLALMAIAALGFCALSEAQPPGGGKEKKGPPGKKKFELGKVLPPFLRESLDLTDEQEAKIQALETEVKTKLLQILTPEQRQRIAEFKGPGKGFDKGPPKDDDKGPPKKDGKGKKGPRDDKGPPEQVHGPAATIQWYATLDSGLREARRSGKPILLVSAAPHCAGVCGIW